MPSDTRLRFEDLPLRERKRARIRLALLDALLSRLGPRGIDQIPVRELCAEVEISEVTFFKHFPAKSDLLTYFIQLWTIEMAWHANQAAQRRDSGLEAIGEIFARTARDVASGIDIMLEVIAHQARMPKDLVLPGVGRAERLLRFPDLPGVENLPSEGLDAILPRFLQIAIDRGELPSSSDIRSLTLALSSLFFGVPLCVGRHDPAAIAPLYRQQLALVWAGARHIQGGTS
ncbi:MAG TPA: TetR/AcrR family transcriptional regulator [Gammaproteobacteria bacterium]|nr:TetR/AcrR family transcriptional regulator [Gammaproteobacteria bacterium]